MGSKTFDSRSSFRRVVSKSICTVSQKLSILIYRIDYGRKKFHSLSNVQTVPISLCYITLDYKGLPWTNTRVNLAYL